MWKSTRKEDEFMTPAPEQTTPKPTQTTAPAAARPMEPARSVDIATIGKSVVVDGEVEGSISLNGQSLTIGPNGHVRANIEARNVIVHGQLNGNIRASERVDLRKSASLTGDISTARVSIEDGAYFKGTIDIQKAEPAPRIEAKPQPASTVASTAAPPSAQGSLLEQKKY